MGTSRRSRWTPKWAPSRARSALMSHTAVGSTQAHADYLLLWIEGGNFVQGGVSSTLSIEQPHRRGAGHAQGRPHEGLIGGLGKVFTVIEGINKLADWLYGDLDPSMIPPQQ